MIIRPRRAAARNSSSAAFSAYDCSALLPPARTHLIDVDQSLSDIGGRSIGTVDACIELGAGLGIAAFEPLAFAISEKRWVLERRHHGAAQGGEPIGRNAGWCAKRAAEPERCAGRRQQRLVGGTLQEIECKRHILEVWMRV